MVREFSHAVVHEAFELCGHRCECADPNCTHKANRNDRCVQFLRLVAQDEPARDGWVAHHIHADQPGTISNCRILCTNCSQQLTLAQPA